MKRRMGCPFTRADDSTTWSACGGSPLQDAALLNDLARFNRERIPERVVHARGAGAHGTFVSSGDFSHLTSNPALAHKGKATPAFARFSLGTQGRESPESLRDLRGLAVRLYTESGNWDITSLSLPVFFIRDPAKFPDLVHANKPSPVTNLLDPNLAFDFFSRAPEATKLLTYLFSDMGTPLSYRHMDAWAGSAYKFVTSAGVVKYVKLFWKSVQGAKFLSGAEAAEQGKDFSSATRDLYTAMGQGDFPSWDLQIQVMDPSQLDSFDFDPLDSTKEWPISRFPFQTLGRLTLDRIPTDFFQFSEQFAACPSNLVPGVLPSEDPILLARLFAYKDAQLYRLGINHNTIPVNLPIPHEKASAMVSSATKPAEAPGSSTKACTRVGKGSDFAQAGEVWRSFSEEERSSLVGNLGFVLGLVASMEVKVNMCAYFYKADKHYGTRIAEAVKVDLADVVKVAATLKG